MKLNSYTIFDSATGAYSRPFFTPADGDAVRQFGDIANDGSHPIGKHPEHYSLFRNGTFDDVSGKFNPEELTHLANAHELKAKAKSNNHELFEPEPGHNFQPQLDS